MNKYLLHGKLTAQDGQQEALASILLQAAQLMSGAPGCRLYAVARDNADGQAVWVTEIWDSKEDHDGSLKVEGVRELITRAMPLLAGPPQKGQELGILGGHGV